MISRLACVIFSALLAASAAALTAKAQVLPDPHADPHEDLVKPPDELPNIPKGERNRNLDFLFGALKAAPDDASAKAVEDRIWAVWTSAGNETTNLLMSRAKKAADDKDYDLAIRMLSAIIEIKPDFMEAWNRRATVYFLKKDYVNAMADIAKVLEREPRHFGALSGLGLIMQEVGDDKHALEAYRKAVEIYPRLKGMDEKIKTLKEKVEGRNI
ncbi:MAG TPA: tetratricopeptide repeat protein [Xanthobacteraceae bacterium]|jgi:tetratricopeptide (TPR) repeat protein|nr:tetratricopeptide repeat protein [Xanthobacteraceae bacterium]